MASPEQREPSRESEVTHTAYFQYKRLFEEVPLTLKSNRIEGIILSNTKVKSIPV